MFRRAVAFIATLIVVAAIPAAACGADSTISPGTVRFAKGAESSFDVYTQNPSAAQKQFMTSRYWRMRTYSPYFNSRLGWFSNAWVYRDSQAIYNPSSLATQHPDWILRDKNGNKLYIQFGCSGGTCPQYAADISNPDFRADWIAGARAQLAAGYKGLFVDDVNMVARTGNGSGAYVPPVDPRTGLEMTDAVWQKYMADFMVQVRSALPGIEIVHNALWPVPDTSADVQRELNAADYIELERGFNDSGITGGTGYWGFQKMAAFIDHRHAAGKGVILDGYADTPAGRMYGLATYFLVNNGRDALANDAYGTPDNWWKGFETELGDPVGPRYQSGGVWRRDFARGTALVNEPGSPTRTVSLGSGFHDVDGVARSSVSLGAASGAVLLRDQTPTDTTVVTTPTPTPTPPVATATPTPTPTATPTPAPPATPGPSPSPTPTPAPAKPRKRRPAPTTATTARASHVNVHGKVRGASAGKVKITIQKRAGRKWKTARKAQAAVSTVGAYSRDVAKLPRGSYRVQARYLGTGSTLPSSSAYHRFSLRG
jgi:Hypothetical glycosyl hydrolase family 15